MNALRSSCAARAGARVVGVEQIGFSEHAADEKERNRPIPEEARREDKLALATVSSAAAAKLSERYIQ